MIVLEKPYVSDLMIEWLKDSQHPVLANEFAKGLGIEGLHLVDEEEAVHRINSGERLYTNSESALSWVLTHTANPALHRAITICKDKAAMRQALAPLNPSVFYAQYRYDELRGVDPAKLPLPVVLKPSVGFCSMGVFVINAPADWHAALETIAAQAAIWERQFPHEVVDLGNYLVESYVEGTEYALDAYFDDEGCAQVLAVFRHDFASAEDTSDRLYSESDTTVQEMAEPMRLWLNRVNEYLAARDFPLHVEVRAQGNTIVPIEINPLRFAGMCCTDLSWYAWGLSTYRAYLENRPVDLPALANAHQGEVFTMAMLKADETVSNPRPFDYEAFAARFTHVLDLRRFDVEATGFYGCLFLQTDDQTADELDFLLHARLEDFCC